MRYDSGFIQGFGNPCICLFLASEKSITASGFCIYSCMLNVHGISYYSVSVLLRVEFAEVEQVEHCEGECFPWDCKVARA